MEELQYVDQSHLTMILLYPKVIYICILTIFYLYFVVEYCDNKLKHILLLTTLALIDIISFFLVTLLQPAVVLKELKMEGFLVNRWIDRWDEGINANLKWLNEGKLKYEEKVYQGFDNMVEALVGILRGENTGKAIVKVK